MEQTVPFATWSLTEGTRPIRLHGGPWDGRIVGLAASPDLPPALRVNGPRDGDHTIWVTHYYVLREGRYEYERTEQTSVGTCCWPAVQ